MGKLKQTMVRVVAAVLLTALLALPLNCNVQFPPDNARTYWGVSIAMPG